MYVTKGDQLIVRSENVGGPIRYGEIVEIPHADGGPPYLVRWADTGEDALVFPGPNAEVQHFERAPTSSQQ